MITNTLKKNSITVIFNYTYIYQEKEINRYTNSINLQITYG